MTEVSEDDEAVADALLWYTEVRDLITFRQ